MKDGIYFDIENEQYHAGIDGIPRLSSSIAKIIWHDSPIKAFLSHPLLNKNYKDFSNKEMDLGTAAHKLLLEKDDSNFAWIDFQDWRTNESKKQREDAISQNKVPLLKKQKKTIECMRDSALEFVEKTTLNGIFDNCYTETTILCDIYNTKCKARLDLINKDRNIIVDYKTSKSANPQVFSSQVIRMGYDIQAAMYLIANLKTGGDRNSMYFWLVQETEYPYLCSMSFLTESMKQIGNLKLRKSCKIWSKCLSENYWPGYDTEIFPIQPKPWEIEEVETRTGGLYGDCI